MAYTVFARKYRPQTFEELVGQEHVARTLANAIEAERVAHAFLFTGVRGVGKTTTARLLAKALNCERGPTASPCNKCAMCLDITAGVDIDVQEIDGASNNSVEDVRRLQESLPFRPARDRFKVVIVDEVHMLSTGAFNAFLKTLEEPPSHVKFIFATTENHKVPVTIKSRCQRYDFRLIPQAVIAERVRAILAEEGVKADDDTVALVAREAAGSMRDALTLLDQLVAFGGQELIGAEVSRHLGIAVRRSLHDTARAILDSDAKQVLTLIDAALNQGAEPVHLARQLLQLFRDLVVLRVTGTDEGLVDLVAEEKVVAREISESADILELQRVFTIVARLVDEVANASSPRLVLEMGLVRAATRPPLRSVAELLARLERLEKGGGGTTPGSRSGPTPRGGGPTRGTAHGTPRSGAGPLGAAAEAENRTHGPVRSTDEALEPAQTRRASASSAEVRGTRQPPLKDVQAGQGEGPPEASPQRATTTQEPKPQPTEGVTSTNDDASSMTAEPAPIRRAALLEWEHIVNLLRESKPALAAVLEHGVPRIIRPDKIVLSFQEDSFYGRQAESPASLEAISAASQAHTGVKPSIEIRFDARGQERATVASVEATRREAEAAARRRAALGHPVVKDAIDVFPDSRGKVEVRLEGDR